MGEIKSAWEIAREKTAKLGKLSQEEQQKQKQDECHLVGKSLTERYLSQHDTQFLKTELSKHDSRDKELISQATLHQLVESIDLRKDSTLERISQGIFSLAKTEAVTEALSKIKELFLEYHQVKKDKGQEIEEAGREILHQLRISGTAIDQINPQAKEEWQGKLDEVAQPFEKRLNTLKQNILS